MRPLGPRLGLLAAFLVAVFLLKGVTAGPLGSLRQGVLWSVSADIPSDATVQRWLSAVGVKGPATPGGTTGTPTGTTPPPTSLVIQWPMPGAIVTPFGKTKDAKTNQTIVHNMVMVSAPAGTLVRSAASGLVTGISKTSEGEMVSVADGPYTFIYRGLGDLKVSNGAAVTAGEILGLLYHQGPGVTSELGFEVEAGTVPIDPSTLMPKTSS